MATSTTFSTLEFLVSVFTHTPECLPHQLSSTMAAKVGRVKQSRESHTSNECEFAYIDGAFTIAREEEG